MSETLTTTDPLAHFGHIMGLVCSAVGAIFLAAALLLLAASRRAHRRGVQTTGTIVGYSFGPPRAVAGGALVQSPDSPVGGGVISTETMGRPSFPVVEFQTRSGASVRGAAHNGSSPRPGRVGDPITVYYDPARPESFWAETSHSRGMSGCVVLILGAVGAVALLAGVALLTS